MMKLTLTIIAIIIGLLSYIPYFRDIIKGKTKPHIFSWFIWSILTFIAFFGQLSDGGGVGSYVTGITALICFIVVLFSFKKGEKNITTSDWISLFGAIFSIFIWIQTKDALVSMILITIVDALGFYPTFRKSFYKPTEETLITYSIAGIKFLLAIFALENYSVITWLYPLSLVIMNSAFVVMVKIRRKQLNK